MDFFDTHCHIHFEDYGLDPEQVIEAARQAGVSRLLCVGCTLADSQSGVAFAQAHQNTWASIGLHPHEAKHYVRNTAAQAAFAALATQPKVVAVGECGLDYYYNHSPREDQIALLEFQLDIAQQHGLPLLFHIREAFDDFWPILENFRGVRGVVHSFTDTSTNLERALTHGLYIGVNGIATFTKNDAQLAAYKAIPRDRLLLETDAPYLTPAPFRGTICEPKHVVQTAEFLGKLRNEPLDVISQSTTANAMSLFRLGKE